MAACDASRGVCQWRSGAGKPAWKEIVDYFGKQVLQEDSNLDRKKLSTIVFRDSEKRKKLESFTHPRISEEFVRHVNEIAEKTPGAIIPVVIPLMIELQISQTHGGLHP